VGGGGLGFLHNVLPTQMTEQIGQRIRDIVGIF